MSNEPVTGLFGRLDPIFLFLDGLMPFPPMIRLLLWGLLAGALSILLYKRFSPQTRLNALAEETSSVRRNLKTMQAGDEGYSTNVMRSVRLSLKRLGLSLAPALLSALPVLFMVSFLDARYGLQDPKPGQPVAVLSERDRDIVLNEGQKLSSGWIVSWPGEGETVEVRDTEGTHILSITPDSRPGLASKPTILTFLFGATAGSLPSNSGVESLVVETTPRDIVQKGLIFPYQWTIPFFLAVILASLMLKFTLRIR